MKMKILDYIFARKTVGAKISRVKECVYNSTSDIPSHLLCLYLECLGRDLYTCPVGHSSRAHYTV